MLGTRIGDYILQHQIGSGGMGTVYAAEHALLGRRVAIKVLPADVLDGEASWRFFNEARAAVQIGHPAIIDVHHFGIDAAGRGYIVMELLDGESLADRLRRDGRLELRAALHLARSLAAALAAAHAAGVIHRDLKPANVFLVRDAVSGGERIKLLDFGIAKLHESLAGPVRTRRNVAFGTPAYMPPEQWRTCNTIDHRADLYALGCILFEVVSGAQPFVADSYIDMMRAHLQLAPPDLGAVVDDVPRGLAMLVAQLLAKTPDDRPASAAAVIEQLDAIERELTRRSVRRTLAIGGIALSIAVAGVPLLAMTRDRVGVTPASDTTGVAAAMLAPAPVEVPPSPEPRATPTSTPTPTPIPSPSHSGASEPVAADAAASITARARASLLAGDAESALADCRRALDLAPDAIQPLLVCAFAACKLGSAPQARRFLERLPAAHRTRVSPNCHVLAGASAETPDP